MSECLMRLPFTVRHPFISRLLVPVVVHDQHRHPLSPSPSVCSNLRVYVIARSLSSPTTSRLPSRCVPTILPSLLEPTGLRIALADALPPWRFAPWSGTAASSLDHWASSAFVGRGASRQHYAVPSKGRPWHSAAVATSISRRSSKETSFLEIWSP